MLKFENHCAMQIKNGLSHSIGLTDFKENNYENTCFSEAMCTKQGSYMGKKNLFISGDQKRLHRGSYVSKL